MHERLAVLLEQAAYALREMASKQKALDAMIQKSGLGDDLTTCGFSVRARKILSRLGISTIAEICEKTEKDLRAAPNCGSATVNEIRQILATKGLWLAGEGNAVT